ncbi:MAG: hypothetical protein JW740_01525 [Candidatus Zambryskibacteria bacterium]|nr:hypothetical protein [Candidatus Zambryskibacteria bacterium]
MNENKQATGSIPRFADLFPEIEKDKLQEAEENFDRYLDLVLRIYCRIRGNSESYKAFKLLTSRYQNSNIRNN